MRNIQFILFVAARYLYTRRKSRGYISTTLSISGIAVGVMTLTAVLSVMNGFQLGFIENILEVGSYHIRINVPDDDLSSAQAETGQLIRRIEGVSTAVLFSENQAIVSGASSSSYPCLVRAVPPDIMEVDAGFREALEIVDGTFDLSGPNQIVIGYELSKKIGCWAGDRTTMLALSGSVENLYPKEAEFRVAGIFRSGYQEYDLNWLFISLEGAQRFFWGDGPMTTTWGVKIEDRYRDRQVIQKIMAVLPGIVDHVHTVVSWREYNRSFFGALLMEKIWMMVLVGLIFIVVGFNIYHSLRRTVYEKLEDIGILKALGSTTSSIRYVFILEGIIIGVLGCFFGLTLGLLISYNIEQLFTVVESVVNALFRMAGHLAGSFFPSQGFSQFTIFSPAYFYISEIPSRVIPVEVFLITTFALLSAVFAAYFAASKASAATPSAILRYE